MNMPMNMPMNMGMQQNGMNLTPQQQEELAVQRAMELSRQTQVGQKKKLLVRM